MRYLTKEWYMNVQYANVKVGLEPDPRAAQFSEAYFQELYDAGEAELLEEDRKMAEYDRAIRSDDYNAGLPDFDIDGNPVAPERLDWIRKFQTTLHEFALKEPPETFCPEKTRANWRERFESALKCVQFRVPQEILDQVADIRVLALDRAAPDIYERICAHCNMLSASNRDLMDSHHAEERSHFPKGLPYFADELDECHDQEIGSFSQQGRDYYLATKCTLFRFVNAKVLKLDRPLEGLTFLYCEVYPLDKGYEIHVLLLDITYDLLQKKDLVDLVLQCEDVIVNCPATDI